MKEAIIQYNDDPDTDGNHMVISWKPLVRCKDCKHLIDDPLFMDDGYCRKMREDYYIKFKPNADWFCADGEKKDDG